MQAGAAGWPAGWRRNDRRYRGVSQPATTSARVPPAASAQSADPAVLFAGLAFAPVIFEFTMAPF
jgi:hypothetical protein